jgi:superfamily II DNA or RNA helicase
MATKITFHTFINSFYKENKISIDSFDEYIKSFVKSCDFSEEFHKCNINKVIGDIFEYIAKYYYKIQNYEVYLFKEIPTTLRTKLKIGTKDKGIDLIYKDNDEEWIGVQCKWRTKKNICIDKNLIAGFIMELNNTNLSSGVVFTNVSLMTKYIKDDNIKWIVRSTLDKKFNNQFIKYIKDELNLKAHVKKEKKVKILWDHQKEAINKLYESPDKNKQCIMFCGTGKSLIMIEYIKKKKVDKTVILMPSLHLITQFYKDLMEEYPKQNVLCICSQMDKESLTCGEEIDEEKANELLDEYMKLETDVKYTTDNDIITKRLKDNKIIVLCTYQSSELLKDSEFDLGIFDEAHKTVNSKKFGFCLHDNNCQIKERIYFTATPRYYKGAEDECVSMNNKEIYGDEIFNYPYYQARDDKKVLDFQIIGYVVPPELEDIIMEKYIKKDDLDIKAEVLITAIQLAKHIQENNNCKKILTYHNTIKNATDYKKTLCYILDKFNITANVYCMSGKTNMTKRYEIFNEFEKDDISIICSSKVLNEGVNLPCVKTIMFVDPRASTIDVTQCIGRGMRLYLDQTTCNVIIPVKYDQVNEQHNYSEIIKILTAMNEIDDKLVEYFVTKNKSNKIRVKNTNVVDICDEIEVKYSYDDIVNDLKTAIIKSRQLGFEYNYALLLEYIKENNCIPTNKTKYKGQNIGSWLQDQKKKISKQTDEIYIKLSQNDLLKNNLDEYLINKEANKDKEQLSWDGWYKLVIEYIEENDCIPIQTIKYKGQNIGQWLNGQKIKINKQSDELYIKLSKNVLLKENLDEYLINKEASNDTENTIWIKWYKLLMEYIEKNNCIPSNKTIYKNQNIGQWLQNQKKKIDKQTDEIYIKLSQNALLKENLDEYLMNKEANKDKKQLGWDEWYKLLIEYIEENDCIPVQKTNYKGQNIGMWLQDQKRKISKQTDEKYIKMSQNALLKENLDEYLVDKETNKEKKQLSWDEWHKLLLEYIEENKCVPIKKTNYKGQYIGFWLHISQKHKINKQTDEIYVKLSQNALIKINLDKYLINKENNKNKEQLNWNGWYKLLIEYIKKNDCIPTKKTIYKEQNIGQWLQNQKTKINKQTDEIYIKLSQNALLKKNLDEYLKKKNTESISRNKKSNNDTSDEIQKRSDEQFGKIDDDYNKLMNKMKSKQNNINDSKHIVIKPKTKKAQVKDIFDE